MKLKLTNCARAGDRAGLLLVERRKLWDASAPKRKLADARRIWRGAASARVDEAAIAQVSRQPNGGLRVKLHDKRAALVDLGRHLGMFAERREHASTMSVEIVRFGQDEGSR